MDVVYREAEAEDMPACVDLFLESVQDLARRHNLASDGPPPAERMLAFYQHTLSTGIFHVAEADGRLAALACAIVRDHLWFLAGFWARPGLQQQHIGMKVLRTGVGGRRAERERRTSSSGRPAILPAMAAYMKLGMLPGAQILAFEGAVLTPVTVPSGIRGATPEASLRHGSGQDRARHGARGGPLVFCASWMDRGERCFRMERALATII